MNDRNETIARIKTALKRRSGKTWSVTGGRGTTWGWITINAPPARRTGHWQKIDESLPDFPQNFVMVDTGAPNGNITPLERDELAELLGLDSVHFQGVSIAASSDYYREYVARAEGRKPEKIAQPYWD